MIWFESVNWTKVILIPLGVISSIGLIAGIIYFFIKRKKEKILEQERKEYWEKHLENMRLQRIKEEKEREEKYELMRRIEKKHEEELKKFNERFKYKEDINITLSLNENLYEASKLNKHEKIFLKNYDYIQRRYTSIDGKKKDYFIKLRFNESPQHCALTYDLYYFLQDYTDEIELFVTKKPDIVFKINDKKYAIEIETGKVKDWRRLREKAERLNKKYKDRWFFVLTNKNLKSRYKKYGPTYDKRNIKKHLLSICDFRDS